MIPSTFDFSDFRTVPSHYSWDKGTPEASTGFNEFKTSLIACSAVSNINDEGVEYVGYAPYVYVSLSSESGFISDSILALRRNVDFGDYYNSDTNLVNKAGLLNELFCHVYVMPGLYTITYERIEYIQAEVPFVNDNFCLQKYCIDWSFKSLSGCPLDYPVTWGSTRTGGRFQKTWRYEACEEQWSSAKGRYVQPQGKEPRLPLTWQWYNFYNQSPNPYNEQITWLSASFQSNEELNWRETVGPCINRSFLEATTWKWDRISGSGSPFHSAIKWDDTKAVSPFNVTWDYTKINCEGTAIPLLSTGVQKITKTAAVRVLEIPPTAYLVADHPSDKTTPLTVRLSPRNTICGSFPIDRIVWDFGDGSPLMVQRRWANTLEAPFVFSGNIPDDHQDPRNYDVIYTYTRSLSSPSSFYPSITAYASSTNSSDCAAATVGPILLGNTTGNNFKLLQNELTTEGKIFLGQIDGNNVSVWRAQINLKDVITIDYIYPYLGYWSNDSNLVQNVSKLYYTKYSNSAFVKNLSGIGDIDKEGNLDRWYTNSEGFVSWDMIIFYPYAHVGYYSADETLVKNESVLYGSQGSAADAVVSSYGYGVDIDGDLDEDSWETNGDGVIAWEKTIFHPFVKLNYYADTAFFPVSAKGRDRLWHGRYSSAALAANLSGIGDVDLDSHLDVWNTDRRGYLTWSKIITHPHGRFNFLSGGKIINFASNSQATTMLVLTGAKSFINTYQGIVSTVLSAGNFTTTFAAASALSGTQTAIYYSSNNSLLDQLIANSTSTIYYTENNQKIVGVLSGAVFSNYYSNDDVVLSEATILWNDVGSGATRVNNVSGSGTDINDDLNTETWSTDGSGYVTWYTTSAYPYKHFGYYCADPVIINQISKLYLGFGDASQPLNSGTGADDIDNDGHLDSWFTDSQGRITYSKIIAHPRYHFGYYSDDITLVSEGSRLWNDNGTGATLVTNASGINDVDRDGNVDVWYTTNLGYFVFSKKIIHPYSHLGYYADDPVLINGYTILYNGNGTGSLPAANQFGADLDMDGDGLNDLWSTNSSGRISWVPRYIHNYPHFGYYADVPILSNGADVIWNSNERTATAVASMSGIADVDGNSIEDIWTTDATGVISWVPRYIHNYPHFGYYADVATLTSGQSVLWYSNDRRSTFVASMSGIADVDGNSIEDIWTTDATGVISWVPRYIHNYPHFGYYADEATLISGQSVLWYSNDRRSTFVANTTGIHDINSDGNDDQWTTSGSGVITWYMISAHPFSNLGYYTDTVNITSGVSTLWTEKGTKATRVVNISSTFDFDGDGNNEAWSTNSNGIVSWYTISAHPFIQFNGYYSDSSAFISGTTILWTGQGTSATLAANVSGVADINLDGNDEAWYTNTNGVITWATINAHPYENLGYYTDTLNLIKGVTVLWNGIGTAATVVSNISGIARVDADGNNDQWTTNGSGVITWYMISAHLFSNLGYYTDTPTIISGVTTLWNSQGTGALKATDVNGIFDFDEDGNNESWSTNENGIISFATIGAHPYPHFGYYADESVLINNYSVLWNDFRTGATIVALASGVNLIDGDNFFEEWSTNESGVISWNVIPVIGKYWYSTTNTNWYNLSNWYLDSDLLSSANVLPTLSTDVIITSGSVVPYIDLDNIEWIQPRSIDATNVGLTFYSKYGAGIQANLSGAPITFLGNSRYGIRHDYRYWRSLNSTDWFDTSNWFMDFGMTENATSVPNSGIYVQITSGSVTPYVNLDDPRWIEPLLINATTVGVTFYSNTSAVVAADMFGSPITFLGNSSFGQ